MTQPPLPMNYLAHLFLSHNDPSITMGNFLGDLIRKKDYLRLPTPLRAGVDLHRKIDSYTDKHPKVKEAVDLLRPYHGRYATVVLDVFFDYLLLSHWEAYTDDDKIVFAQRNYDIINQHITFVPNRYRPKVQGMVRENWLVGYGQWDQLHDTFLRVKKRARFDGAFDKATTYLKAHQEELAEKFQAFFPEIFQWTKAFVEEHRLRSAGVREASDSFCQKRQSLAERRQAGMLHLE